MKKEDKNNQISSYLKTKLDEKDISQKQVQLDLAVSQQYVSALINGDKSIGKRMAKKLSDLYDLDETILLGVSTSDDLSDNKYICYNVDDIKNKPHDRQMEILFNKITDLEGKIQMYQERDRQYFEGINAKLNILTLQNDNEKDEIKNEKSDSN
jgi:plasmid maintenance system antidote protein VapI